MEAVESVERAEVDVFELVLAGTIMEDVSVVVATALDGGSKGLMTSDKMDASGSVLADAAAEVVGTLVVAAAAGSAKVLRKRRRSVTTTRNDIVKVLSGASRNPETTARDEESN